MAASDKPFHNQRTLDIVFAVSNILMLLSTIWMLWQDHYREYKVEQRFFVELEVAMAQRKALDSLPSTKEFEDAKAKVEKGREFRKANETELSSARAALISLRPAKENAETDVNTVKADVASFTSLLNIAIEHGDNEMKKKYEDLLVDRNTKLVVIQATNDDVVSKMKLEQLKIERIEGDLTKAVAEFKKVNDRFDTQVKLALNKRWGFTNWLRTQPVINGFAEPLKIHQFTIDDIPIDYNFKKVSRFDRCMTCHQGIDRPGFTRENLMSLTKEDVNKSKLEDAKKLYEERIKVLDPKDAASVPNPGDLRLITISDKDLTASRVTEFCAHPRLDLFVGANSKHPAEKFGCTSCHSGQGSGTTFVDASHSPNSMDATDTWNKDRGWEFNHQWDFPMLPRRFVESSCLKCHHEVTDLVSSDNRNEAPKLLRGHELIRENGCFGCHEISGVKNGVRIGPDMRLEPSPPLEELNAMERNRAVSDPDNRPGNLRKVGPALTRVSEKVNEEWIKKWLRSPSAFRPDTKMPHYYGLSNNDKSVLPEDQKKFPDTEIASIAYFLTATSEDYLKKAKKQREDDSPSKDAADKDQRDLVELLNKGRLTPEEQDSFAKIKTRMKYRKEMPLEDLTPDYDPKLDESRLAELRKDAKPAASVKQEVERLEGRVQRNQGKKKYEPDAEVGRVLFIERGCLACHTHQGTEKSQGNKAWNQTPAISSEAMFGPNLTQVAEKFTDKAKGRKWLIQWIMDPQVHSPRSRMPVTHLTANEAADVAAWLLAQPSLRDDNDPWHKIVVEQPDHKDLENLARVYLTRMLSKSDMEKRFFKGLPDGDADKLRKLQQVGGLSKDEADIVRKREQLSDDSLTLMMNDITDDEKKLLIDGVKNDDSLKFYLGKKAVTRLGCFACHDIPGFESAKSIGVALNDWGKKPADRLAFEDIDNFFKAHYQTKDEHNIKDGKEPYEKFYAEALTGHHPQRHGYLNQKIRDPRSYDYNRIRAWDDRARMPKFTLARPRKHEGEKEDEFKGRIFKEEAAARESVATFVLGLVAEPVPTKSINQPTGDRLAEVKGRQILDKYNCARCHLIRPGVYDFKPGTKSMEQLIFTHGFEEKEMEKGGEIKYLNHINWVGRNPLGDKLTAYGSQAKYEDGVLRLTLNEAIRFEGKDKKAVSIPAGSSLINLPIEDFGGEPASLKTQEDFNRRFASMAPFGGSFANLMTPWLMAKDKDRFPAPADAGGSLPPSLVGQGERTQPDWLYNFLLNPQPVRRLSVLRMPKFNMSKEEAKMLVDYFAAVTRQTNPGIGLPYPHEAIASRDDAYWRTKTAEYVAHLKNAKVTDKTGKELGNLFDARIKAYEPIWERIRKETEPGLKAKLEELGTSTTKKKTERDASQVKYDKIKDSKDAKDDDKKAEFFADLNSAKAALAALTAEKTKTDKALVDLDEKTQQKMWETEDAYAADAYRMLTSRELCAKCHQIGNTPASASDPTAKQGPPLDLAFGRLRPDWIERWVDKPQRFVPYQSLMPAYFNKSEMKYQELHAGPAHVQIQALRDVLMNYPRLANMPINRIHNPDRK